MAESGDRRLAQYQTAAIDRSAVGGVADSRYASLDVGNIEADDHRP